MRRFLIRALAAVGALTVLLGLGVLALMFLAMKHAPTVPAHVVLETEFHRGLVEQREPLSLESFGRDKPTVRDIVDALARAAEDNRVAVLVSDLSELQAGLAQIEELHDAVVAFRKKGKRAIAFADTFGELSPANGAFYLATAFDEIYVQPSGSVGLTGMGYRIPFGRELLDRVGVKPSFFGRKEYKSAPESLTQNEITAPNREQMEAVLDSQVAQLVRGVAEGRSLKEAKVRELLDRGPLQAQEALQERLVDGLLYRDEVYAKVRAAAASAKPLFLSAYLERAGRLNAHAPDKVALIFGTGEVERGGPEEGLSARNNMRSGEIASAFRRAVADKRVKAIVFRIDSPGGSYVASDTIRRAVELARKNGKPVVASMGNVAASGGYFAAMDADKVVAEPATLTGSIGVFAGKLVLESLYSKLGIHWATLARGANATLMSTTADYTPQQRARMDAWLDAVYADFTQKAAAGRNLSLAKLQENAKGRVWTGEDAKKRGLVDALGGFTTAIKLAKEAANVSEKTPVAVEVFPPQRSPIEEVAALVSGRGADNSEDEEALTRVRVSPPTVLQRLETLAQAVGLGPPSGPLRSTPPDVLW